MGDSAATLANRPDILDGATFQLKPSGSEHAFYVTINHTTVEGTPRLMEIFVNSKSMENFAWIVALTRVMSAIFRQDPNPAFLVEELKSVFDPRGGYWKKGGVFMPSLVAEIGDCLQARMTDLGITECRKEVRHG
ncbi:MAG: hypothetical protein HQL85_19600 [Magnetococcales bacterium]|nr:hypothetical protein [Magnetococcales bacterium]